MFVHRERTEVDMEMRHRGERDSSASHWERENYRGRETQREGYQERYRDSYRERDRSRECSPPRRPRPRIEPEMHARDVMSRLWLILICIVVVIPFSLAARFVPKWKKQACEIPASQNEHSHYVCTDNGDVKCLPGWMGDLCDVPMCKKGCDPLQGYCKRPGECRCKLGFYGEMCNKCIALPGCQHGNCNNSFECNCQEGWDGLFCSEHYKGLNYCEGCCPKKRRDGCLTEGKTFCDIFLELWGKVGLKFDRDHHFNSAEVTQECDDM
uniref:EGF-like domain-containing protein n=1 Tax=Timema poppense TaxID=170557 RepID=A0A7R9H201_TIMPO|nr:unnamed protein product [Timema poppensis]